MIGRIFQVVDFLRISAMSRFLLLNFEDFGLNQDITKTIQPFNPFCICCLDRNGPMFDLENCRHSDYLDAFEKPELKQFHQLVCYQCHCILKKIKSFQSQVKESYAILLSGEFTNTTANNKKLNSLDIQKVVVDLHLPPDIGLEDSQEGIGNNQDFTNIQNDLNMEQNFVQNLVNVVQNDANISGEQNFSHNMADVEKDNSKIELIFAHDMVNVVEDNSNIEQHFTNNMADVEPNLEPYPNIEENLIQQQNRLNKNIKTALEILDRNNQSFMSLSSQLQFLNGEHLSFLEPSLLSKEILTDIPLVLVPAKSLSTDLENGLLNNSKSLEIEIDGPDKMFYDSLGLSPELMEKEPNAPEIIENVDSDEKIQKETEPKIKSTAEKPKKKMNMQEPNPIGQIVRKVKLTQKELDVERVKQAQSNTYLKYKFRCKTCIVSFNYKENLKDHIKRKHGPREGDAIVCEICSQLIPNAGCVTEHNYRHYARYDCMRCNKRHHTLNEAIEHYTKNQCFKSATKKRSLKNKPTVQLKRVKLKMKPA